MRKFKRKKFYKKMALPLAATVVAAATALSPAAVVLADNNDSSETSASVQAVEATAPSAVESFTYDGKEHALCTVKSVPGVKYEFTLSESGDDSWSAEIPKGKNAGTYNVRWRIIAPGEYKGPVGGSFSVQIYKAIISKFSVEKKNMVYNGNPQPIKPADVKLMTENGVEVPADAIELSGNTQETNAGEYRLSAKINQNHSANYAGNSVSTSYKIEKKQITSDMVKNVANSFVYDGLEQTPRIDVADVVGLKNIMKPTDYKVEGTTKAKEIGQYTAVVKATDTGNYKGSVDAHWDIHAQGVKKQPEPLNRTYDGTEKELVKAGETDNGTKMLYKIESADTIPSEQIPKAKDAGTYVVEYGFDNGVYQKLGTVEVTIEQAEIYEVKVLNDKPFVYNASPQGYDPEDLEVKAGDDGLKIQADEYTINDNKMTDAGEYELSVTPKSSNFKGKASTPWKIDKAPLHIAALEGVMMEYNGTKSGLLNINNQKLNGLYMDDKIVLEKISGTFEDKNVGLNKMVTFDYGDIVWSGEKAANYALNLVDAPKAGTGTIVPKKLTSVEGITADAKTYDGSIEARINSSLADFEDVVSGDKVSIYDVTGLYKDANVGKNKEIHLDYSKAKLGGQDAGNYMFDSEEGKDRVQRFTLGDIEAKELTEDIVKIDGNFIWDGDFKFPTIMLSDEVNGKNIISNDDISYDGTKRKDVGTYELEIKATPLGNYKGKVTGTWAIQPMSNYDYDIVEGDRCEYQRESGAAIVIAANGPADKFQKLLIDDMEVDSDNYTVFADGTEITIKPEYLDTLKVGEHTFSFVYEDGESNIGTFTIKEEKKHNPDEDDKKPDENNNSDKKNDKSKKKKRSVKTGDYTSSTVWSTALIISAAAVGAGVITAIKLRKKER